MSTRCEHDTGSMYGNRPACDAVATWTLTYGSLGEYGTPGRYAARLCGDHALRLPGRIFPDVVNSRIPL